MKQEQILSIVGPNIYTNGGRRIAIGNADHKVGNWVWVDSGCVFGHSAPHNNPFIPTTPEDVYIEVCDKFDNNYTFRLTTIKRSGREIIKEALCTLPITPTSYYGYKIYYFDDGHFVYDSQGCAFFEYTDAGMKVHLYKNGVWSQGVFDARNTITAEFIDGELYWSGTGLLNYTVTSYQNLIPIKSVDFTDKFTSRLADFKSYAQGELDGFLLEHGTQKYTITDQDITKSWSAYYEDDEIRAWFSIFISTGIYEPGSVYHSFVGIVNVFYLGNEIYQGSRHLSYDDVIDVNDEHTYTDTNISYRVDSKYRILSSTRQTFYTLVDIVNHVTYDWTPFSDLLKNLFNELYGTMIAITEINADTLYIYIAGADFIFTKSENTLTAINQSGFALDNQQLTQVPKGTANKFIKAIKDEWEGG